MDEKQIGQEIVDLVRKKIGAVAALKKAMIVNWLPKPRSVKILRKLIRRYWMQKNFRFQRQLTTKQSGKK